MTMEPPMEPPRGDGAVVCWGDRTAGGDAARLQAALETGEGVRQVAASARAFAAVLEVARAARGG